MILKHSKLFQVLLVVGLVSCGPPEEFKNGLDQMANKKFKRALMEFDRLDPEDKEWLDSAENRKEECFQALINRDDWSEFEESCNLYDEEGKFVRKMKRLAVDAVIERLESDSVSVLFELLDNKDNGMSEELKKMISAGYLDQVLTNSYWKGEGELRGHEIYFKWKDSEKDGEPAKLHGYSNNYQNGWSKDMLMYMNIRYSKGGKFALAPRTWRFGSSSFRNNWGTLVIMGADKLKIYYGGFSHSNYFVRGDDFELTSDN